MSFNPEIHLAQMELAADMIIDAWENTTKLTEKTVQFHLEALLDVMEEKTTIIDFKLNTNLTGRTWLQ